MIIWAGLGWVVAAIIFGCLFATEYLIEAASGDEFFYQEHGWPKLVGFLVAAIVTHGFALLRAKKKSRLLVDPKTGEEVILHANDSLFFIPLRYWPKVTACLGLIFLFVTEKRPG